MIPTACEALFLTETQHIITPHIYTDVSSGTVCLYNTVPTFFSCMMFWYSYTVYQQKYIITLSSKTEHFSCIWTYFYICPAHTNSVSGYVSLV